MVESAFAWLGELINWFGRWIPRLTIVDTTKGWVKYVKGSHVASGGPGLVWHWPLVTELVVFAVVRDSLNCQAQTITLASGETVLVEAVVIFEVPEIEKLVAATAEPTSTIVDLTMMAVAAVIETFASWQELVVASTRKNRARDTELNYRLKDEVEKALQPYGVRVLSVMLKNKAKARVYKLVND